jgi:hypothetical protein
MLCNSKWDLSFSKYNVTFVCFQFFTTKIKVNFLKIPSITLKNNILYSLPGKRQILTKGSENPFASFGGKFIALITVTISFCSFES